MIKGLAAFVSSQYWDVNDFGNCDDVEPGDRREGGMVIIMMVGVGVGGSWDNDHFRRLLAGWSGQGQAVAGWQAVIIHHLVTSLSSLLSV